MTSLYVNNISSSEKIYHADSGTFYGDKAILAYAESNHGADGSVFLDPYFKPAIENIQNQTVLDAGCGAAPWSIYAASQGGKVFAIDFQEEMVMTAKKAIKAANMVKQISICKGDVAFLPYQSNFFDKAISICVGCNLSFKSFDRHFSELKRTLKDQGIAVIGAPYSLHIVFSNDSKTESEVLHHIQEILNQLPDNPDQEQISEHLLLLNEVTSATFYIKENRLTLLRNEDELEAGDKIWRKLPKLVVPNIYYTAINYLTMFEKYHFKIEQIDVPRFDCEKDRIQYNQTTSSDKQLGKSYASHAPFIIFHIKKVESKKIKIKLSPAKLVATPTI